MVSDYIADLHQAIQSYPRLSLFWASNT